MSTCKPATRAHLLQYTTATLENAYTLQDEFCGPFVERKARAFELASIASRGRRIRESVPGQASTMYARNGKQVTYIGTASGTLIGTAEL